MDNSEHTLESIDKKIASTNFTVVVSVANWKKSCQQIINDIKSTNFDSDVNVICLTVDSEDPIEEELSHHLNIKTIPSMNIYKPGGELYVTRSNNEVNIKTILSDIKCARNPSCKPSSCCDSSSSCEPSSTSCCAPTTSCCTGNDDNVLKMVSSYYADTLKGSKSCCVSTDSVCNGYSLEELTIAANANLGLGCGNPMSFANITEGNNTLE
jgi:hypothetical protein